MAGTLTLRAVAAATNEPIEGVSIEYRGAASTGRTRDGTVTTGKDGMATIEYPPSVKTGSFRSPPASRSSCPSTSSGTTSGIRWNCRPMKELRFEPGTTIGGIVKDEAGHPIAGAAVDVVRRRPSTKGRHHVFSLGELETDAQGRWRLDIAPQEPGRRRVEREHPRYRRNGGSRIRNLDGVIVLTKGLTVTGRVVDAAGRPVKGARAISATTPSAPTLRPGRRTIGASSPWRTATPARPSSRCRPRASRPDPGRPGRRTGPHPCHSN